jgi:hypothetical protein
MASAVKLQSNQSDCSRNAREHHGVGGGAAPIDVNSKDVDPVSCLDSETNPLKDIASTNIY